MSAWFFMITYILLKARKSTLIFLSGKIPYISLAPGTSFEEFSFHYFSRVPGAYGYPAKAVDKIMISLY